MKNLLVYQIALTQIPRIGNVTAKHLISYCGGVNEVFERSLSYLKKIPGIGVQLAENIKSFNGFERIEREVATLKRKSINTHFFLDENYPYRLKQISDGPIMLYSRGKSNLNPSKCIAIVGTRKMTPYGQQFITQLIESLVPYQPTIVSGLAYGVDVWAHKQSLKNQLPTFGIVAHGLDQIYPSAHANVASDMMQTNGAIITEYMTKTSPRKEYFPMRNRLVAGFVDAVIVVESARKGGSLITAELANQYNRDVLALPGDVMSTYSAGCNALIKENKAHLIEQSEDLIKLLNWDIEPASVKVNKSLEDFSANERTVLILLQEHGVMSIDELTIRTGFESNLIAITLLELEMNNGIISLPGKRYQSLVG